MTGVSHTSAATEQAYLSEIEARKQVASILSEFFPGKQWYRDLAAKAIYDRIPGVAQAAPEPATCVHRIAVTPRNGAPHGAGFACGLSGGHCIPKAGCGFETVSRSSAGNDDAAAAKLISQYLGMSDIDAEDAAYFRAVMRDTGAQPPSPAGNEGLICAAQFLLDRLDEFDPGDDEPEREYHGHVAPAIARLRSALTETVPQEVLTPKPAGVQRGIPTEAELATAYRYLLEKPSTSYIQRKMGIGYNHARAIIETLENEGVISKPDSTGRRTTLALSRPERCDGADDLEHLDGMLDDRERG